MNDCEQNCAELLAEIDRLKMMLDAAVIGQETMQKKWKEDVERLTAERDAATEDLKVHGGCPTNM